MPRKLPSSRFGHSTRKHGRLQSGLAAEAIAASIEVEAWQRKEIRAGIKQLEAGSGLGHAPVSNWLKSWGRVDEGKPPQ
ncbi:MAG: hypothetical protein ABI811_06385 [Acidobacteriota bacterium]